ncbi:MAG: S8 family serine peptidase, partial [Acidobacteria bacterium]|nr:S8 family serine peptidase [Acidobacteriota bacterium]
MAALLVCALGAGAVRAGITVTGTDGITMTGTDGVSFVRTSGITTTGTDGLLAFGVNGITATGTDGITMTGTDGVTYTGANLLAARGVDTLTVAAVDGITMTGTDGITMTGTDGVIHRGDSLFIRRADGIVMTGTDGITMTGTDGITMTGTDALNVARANGIVMTGTDGITMTGTDGITMTGTDGRVFSVAPTAVSITGADGITMTGTDGITMTGTDGRQRVGLQSVDPELAIKLDRATDDSSVNAVVVYHRPTTDADLADLQRLGLLGGTRYRALPLVAVTATRRQIIEVSRLPAVRSIYGNRTLQTTADPYRAQAGAERVARDGELTGRNDGLPLTGRGVNVAVLDTGLDGTHADLAGRVVRNVKLVDTQSASVGFTPPAAVEGLPNTDQVYGHGTFVGGLIAGSGARSGGAFGGVAPGAGLVGLSAGDLSLFHILSGFDYLAAHPELNIRVVNCSFSANTVYDENDPVNVATKQLTDAGVNVVFSAGNTGPGAHSLNPYAAAPWVVSVGSTDRHGRLADFSSRGDFGSRTFRPTLVAPGVDLVSLRSSGLSVVGVSGLAAKDAERLTAAELPHYTTGSGTSASAPQVAGVIALMLEADPGLSPAEVRDALQRT